MNAASLTSNRLQRVLAAMAHGEWMTPDEITRTSGHQYNPAITELRKNGVVIESRRMVRRASNSRAFEYRLARTEVGVWHDR